MKRIFTLLMACTFALSLSAQMADGTVVPDFTTTDLNGNSFNLYEHLDAGKTVIIDVFAVWCGPCWSYHGTHALEDTYCQLGLNGTEDVVVIAIEGDGSTAVSEITGGGSSIGDWTDGVSYSIADDAAVANLLEIAYYPTIYKICPSDKTIYEMGQQPANTVFNQVFDASCKPPTNVKDVASLGCGAGDALCAGQSTNLKAEVINRGSEAAAGVSVKAFDTSGAEIASGSYSGNIASYSKVEVDLGSYVASGADEITYEVIFPGDEVEGNNSASKTISLAPITADNVLTLDLTTDNYGYETYWEFRDQNGNVFASGGNETVGPNGGGAQAAAAGNPGAYGNNETINEMITLPEGVDCYEFLIVDDYGDGICCAYGDGSFSVSDAQGVVVSGGEFAASGSKPFSVDAVNSANEVEVASSMKVFPNPVTDQLTVEFGLEETEKIDITVYNALGQAVRTLGTTTYTAGTQIVNIDASAFEAGMYMVTLRGAEYASTRKFTVAE